MPRHLSHNPTPQTPNPLLQRWLTALVLIPVLLAVLLKGGRAIFAVVILLVGALGWREFLHMFQIAGEKVRQAKVIILGTLVSLSFCLAPRTPHLPLFVLVGCLFALFLFYLLSFGHIAQPVRELALNTLGLLYLSFLAGHFIWLRFLAGGEWWVLWLLAVIFAGDTAAFFTGRAMGQKKLYPAVSPGKTWEGTIGGWAANLIVGVGLGRWWLPQLSPVSLAWLALALGLLGMVGDLFESMLKRQAAVKDAGTLLPGHGGMLDRLDSLLFTAPALLYARLLIFNL